MQYKSKMTLQCVTEFNDLGEPKTTEDKEFKCCVLKEEKVNKQAQNKKRNQYDMEILVSAKTYEPYNKFFKDNDARCLYDGKTYEIIVVSQINNFSGKPKYFQISLKQVS